MKIPVDRSTGSAASVGSCDVGPGLRFVGVFAHPRATAPQQNFGIPTPGSVWIVPPSALTVAVPAIRQSFGASPLRGDSSKYQRCACSPGASPSSFGASNGTGCCGVPPPRLPK
jgi:hypothetical protein